MSTGGFVDYYRVSVKHPQRKEQAPYDAECEDITEALGLNPDEFNIFKEIWRTANERTNGNGKAGNDRIRAAEKLVHYANRILRREQNAAGIAEELIRNSEQITRCEQHITSVEPKKTSGIVKISKTFFAIKCQKEFISNIASNPSHRNSPTLFVSLSNAAEALRYTSSNAAQEMMRELAKRTTIPEMHLSVVEIDSQTMKEVVPEPDPTTAFIVQCKGRYVSSFAATRNYVEFTTYEDVAILYRKRETASHWMEMFSKMTSIEISFWKVIEIDKQTFQIINNKGN